MINWLRSLMDRTRDSGSLGGGSIPSGATKFSEVNFYFPFTKKIFFLFSVIFLFIENLYSQISIDTTMSVDSMVKKILLGQGVDASRFARVHFDLLHELAGGHRGMIAQGVGTLEGQLGHMRVHGDLQVAEHAQGARFGGGFKHRIDRDIACCTRAVFDHHIGAQGSPEAVGGGSGDEVGHPAHWVAHHEFEGAAIKVLGTQPGGIRSPSQSGQAAERCSSAHG